MTSARGTAEGAIARARAKEREREREGNMNSPFQGDKHRIAPEEALSGAEKEMEVIDEAGAVVPYSKRKLSNGLHAVRGLTISLHNVGVEIAKSDGCGLFRSKKERSTKKVLQGVTAVIRSGEIRRSTQ